VVGVPADGERFAFISCGTWSLVGVEVSRPAITPQALALNLTNEGGVENTFRLLRNVMGLWLVQGIRHTFERQGDPVGYADLVGAASEATALRVVLDPDAPVFLRADDMVGAIRDFCTASHQPAPETPGTLVRAALESLALRYRWVIEHLEQVTGRPIDTIHLVGGGARNRLLCQMTADATGRLVLAGPTEATALGNLAVQAIAAGRLGSLGQAREVIARSFAPEEFKPASNAAWSEAYGRFCALSSGGET
jgi:rhamnulokinase